MNARKRTCLKCGEPFESTHAGNRICHRCAHVNARLPISEEQLQKQRGRKRRNGQIIDMVDDDNPGGKF